MAATERRGDRYGHSCLRELQRGDSLTASAPPAAPAVTVIALCFNHARFLHECLESIAAQTFQAFQLIVTDDRSTDGSADLIAAWIRDRRPDAEFIRHEQNRGLCPTLNEAVALARGEFISIIATDDAWEPDKLESQLAAMRDAGEGVAVVYSDATRMDEQGQRLLPDFIEAHAPESARPSGAIFTALAERNFIPAMSNLIRRSALTAVGGYDERLSYEDYDMWLRLADRFEFLYVPGALARYRIVGTSIVRTTFAKPTPRHLLTQCLIANKWLGTGRLTPQQERLWGRRLWDAAYGLFAAGHAAAPRALWRAAWYDRNPRALGLAVASSVGLDRERLRRWLSRLGQARS